MTGPAHTAVNPQRRAWQGPGAFLRRTRGGVAAPLPTDLADLMLWLDADQGLYDATSGGSAVTADDAAIASWEPRAGSVTSRLTQGTAAQKPRYDATGGMVVGSTTPSLFSGFWWLDFPASFTIDRQDCSVFAIVEADHCWGGAAASYPFFSRASADNWNLHLQDTSGRMSVYDGSFKVGGATAVPTHTRCLIGWVGSASNLKFWRNGDSTTATASGSGTATLTRLFGYDGSNKPCFWSIKDVMIYDRALSDSEVTDTLLAYATGSRSVVTSFTADVVCAGDSITHGYGSTCNRGWPHRLTLASDVRITIPAYSGALASTIDTQRSTLIDPLVGAGDVVVVWAGTNDIAAGASAATAYTSLSNIVTGVQATGAACVLVTPLPRGAGSISGDYATLRNSINTNTAGADAIADPIADATLAAAWGDDTYDYDDIHPNGAGYALIKPIIQTAIESVL